MLKINLNLDIILFLKMYYIVKLQYADMSIHPCVDSDFNHFTNILISETLEVVIKKAKTLIIRWLSENVPSNYTLLDENFQIIKKVPSDDAINEIIDITIQEGCHTLTTAEDCYDKYYKEVYIYYLEKYSFII